MTRIGPTAGIAALMAGLAAIAAAQAPGESEFPDRPGREAFFQVCAHCHAPTIVLPKRMYYQDWKDLVSRMNDLGGGNIADDDRLEEIAEYLAASYPPEDRSVATTHARDQP